jgi:RNase P/RNase MRP subunit p30
MFYDLCLNYENPNNSSIEKYREFCELLTSAVCDNYQIFAINTNRKGTLTSTDIPSYKEVDLKLLYQNYSIKFLNAQNSSLIDWSSIKQLKRITISVADSKDLFQFTNPSKSPMQQYDIVAVAPENEKVFELCLNDLNVDLISLNYEEKINFPLKKHQILSAISKNTYFEIIYGNFIKDTTKRSLFISNVLLLLDVTKGKNIIISSGAESFYEHRSPYDIVTIFETIFEMRPDVVKKMISDNCEKVLLKSIQRKFYKNVMLLEVDKEGRDRDDNKMNVEQEK